jgi:hypothetical protein
MFSRSSKCHANSNGNGMHAKMRHQEAKFKREGNTHFSSCISATDKEQGRTTLHLHWQIWVTEINQTLQDCLFHEDITKRNIARKLFCKQIDNVMAASYGSKICIIHKCLNENNEIMYKHDMLQK